MVDLQQRGLGVLVCFDEDSGVGVTSGLRYSRVNAAHEGCTNSFALCLNAHTVLQSIII
jgi:hypothetical protein